MTLYSEFETFMQSNKPNFKEYKSFYTHPSFKGCRAWWDSTMEGNLERVRFCDEIIKQLK